MPLDGDYAILRFRMMDEKKQDNPHNKLIIWKMKLCLVTCWLLQIGPSCTGFNGASRTY
jgi:hypothetical protein